MTIGNRIKQLRQSLGMTQEELAELTGYKSRSSIQKIESGERDITQSTIVLFAKALQTTPSVIMGWEEEKNPPDVLDVHAGDDAFVLSKYNRLSIPNRYETLKYMDKLYEEQEAEEAAAQMNNIG